MKRKLLLLVSLVALNVLFILPFSKLSIEKQNVARKIETINDNVLLASKSNQFIINDLGYPVDYMKNVEKIEGIDNVEFINMTMLESYYTVKFKDNYYDYQVFNDFEIFDISPSLSYIAGHGISKDNGTIISYETAQRVVDTLGLSSIDDVIGKTVKIGDIEKKEYEIEGVYDNTLDCFWENFIISDSDVGGLEEFSSEKERIEDYNRFIGSNENNAVKSVTYKVKESCESEWCIEDGYIEKEYIDYEKSVENGVEGLIDPNTDVYPEKFTNFMIIELNEGTDENQVISEIENIDSSIKNDYLTNKSKPEELLKINNIYSRFGVIILLMIECIIYIVLYASLYSSFLRKGKLMNKLSELFVVSVVGSAIAWVLSIVIFTSIWEFEILVFALTTNLIAVVYVGGWLYIKELIKNKMNKKRNE